HAASLIDFQQDIGAAVGFEPRRFYFERVGGAGNSRIGVNAVFIGDRGPGSAALLVARRDDGSDNGAAGGVGNPAGQARADFLSVRRQAECDDDRQGEQDQTRGKVACITTFSLRNRHDLTSRISIRSFPVYGKYTSSRVL